MTVLAQLITDYGWPVVAGAAIIFILLRSDFRISYPGRKRKAGD